MEENQTQIIGAVLVGVAIVGGAFLLREYVLPHGGTQPTPVQARVSSAPERSAIDVTDTDNDGVEDWQEEFLTEYSVSLTAATSTYEAPDTLTGRTGIALMEEYIINKSGAVTLRNPEDLTRRLAERAIEESQNDLIGVDDIIVISDSPEAVRVYGNQAALVLRANAVGASDHELELLRQLIVDRSAQAQAELRILASSTAAYRDETLAIPVPESLVKPHLDLVNTYHALATALEVFTDPRHDPLRTFVHLRRYEDDMIGFQLALNNLYDALSEQGDVFERNDPALLFASQLFERS